MPAILYQSVTLKHAFKHWQLTTDELVLLLDDIKKDKLPFLLEEQCQLCEMKFSAEVLRLWLEKRRRLQEILYL